jgi:hypothetical protein
MEVKFYSLFKVLFKKQVVKSWPLAILFNFETFNFLLCKKSVSFKFQMGL